MPMPVELFKLHTLLGRNQSIIKIEVFDFMLFQVQQPSTTAYFRIYSSEGALVYSKDASSYFDYRLLPNNTVEMKLDEKVNFQEKKSYYVIVDPGFAKSSNSCGVDSQAVMEPNYWKFTISKTRSASTAMNLKFYFIIRLSNPIQKVHSSLKYFSCCIMTDCFFSLWPLAFHGPHFLHS